MAGPPTVFRSARPARTGILAATLLLVAAGVSTSEAGGWPSNPTINVPASTAAFLQHLTVSTPDGRGGIFIVWEDARKSPPFATQPDIYGQHIDWKGDLVSGWAANGAPICTTSVQALTPQMVPDDSGGVLVTFSCGAQPGRPGGIYVQRMDADGTPRWPVNGVRVSGSRGGGDPMLCKDGLGGAFVAWREGSVLEKVAVQHIDRNGALLWGADGVLVADSTRIANGQGIVPDGLGGAFVAWSDFRSQFRYQVFAQRVSSSGTRMWGTDGVPVSTSPYGQASGGPSPLVSDGAGGIFVGWIDNYTGDPGNTLLQHLAGNGTLSPGWPAYGLPVSFDPIPSHMQAAPLMTEDGAGGVELTFRDSRNFGFRITAQRVDFAGNLLWGPSGASAFAANGGTYHATVSDSSGGYIIGTISSEGTIFVQRLDSLGVAQWIPEGIVLSDAVSVKRDLSASPDGAHGAIFAWTDDRNESSAGYYGGDIYAQNVNANGTLGGTIVATEMALASAEALPDRVRLKWFGGSAGSAAVVYRSADGASWSPIARVVVDGSGYLGYEDRDVLSGQHYAYRLGVGAGGAETYSATTWLEIPASLALSLDGPWPQPAGEDLVFRYTLPSPAAARLRLHDLQGRAVATLLYATLGAGQHTRRWRLRDLLGRDLPGGVYFARFEVAGHTLTRRVVIAP